MNEVNSSKILKRTSTNIRKAKSTVTKTRELIIDVFKNTDKYETKLTNILVALTMILIVIINALLFLNLGDKVQPGTYVPKETSHTYATKELRASFNTTSIKTINEPIVYDTLVYETTTDIIVTTDCIEMPNTTESEVKKIYESVPLDADLQQFAYSLCEENNVPFEILMSNISRIEL